MERISTQTSMSAPISLKDLQDTIEKSNEKNRELILQSQKDNQLQYQRLEQNLEQKDKKIDKLTKKLEGNDQEGINFRNQNRQQRSLPQKWLNFYRRRQIFPK